MAILAKGCALLIGLSALAAVAAGAEEALFDFEGGFDFAAVEARDVKVAEAKTDAGSALRIESYHHQPWPGITLKAPKGHWDLSAYESVRLSVRNVGANEVTVACRVDNPGADGVRNCNTANVVLKPGESGTLTVKFKRKPQRDASIKLWGMRGYPEGLQDGDRTIDPANVTQLLVFVARPKEDHAFEIDDIRAVGEYVPPETAGMSAADFFPFIDAFGQYIHRDWPGKTHSAADLAKRLQAERLELRQKPGPPGWDEYGGWEAGPTLKATGFFRTEKYKGKWWLVDPKGKLFFSHGIDCVGFSDDTPIDDRESWFRNFPGDDPDFKEFLRRSGRVIRDYYKGKRPMCFDFGGANIKRKYGEDWRRKFAETSHRRLRSWGMNTIANWSDSNIYSMRKTPYVVAIHFGGKPLQGSRGYWGQFRDVFDPDFKAKLRERMAREVGKTAGDPWCIGYFVDNEIAWGDEVSLAIAALVSPPEQVAKQVFIEDLKEKYKTIEALNEAWGAKHASWQALLENQEPPDRKRAEADLKAFYSKTAERYFETCRDAVKEIAPDNLYLGCRFAWVNPLAVAAAVKYCDVVSYNIYRRSAANFKLPIEADVPLIIGEFHFGALDRGMFHTGLVKVKDQAERAATYEAYVNGVLDNPNFVGCHWFKYRDESTIGRPLDGENYQIGFVDIADTPYTETIQACRQVGYSMYERRAGR